MALDPQIKMMLEQAAAAGQPPLTAATPAQARRNFDQMLAAFAGPARDPVARVEDRSIPGPAGPLEVRIYTPAGAGPFPLLVFFHGGGWVLGDLESHDPVCRALTNGAGCLLVSVNYRLAPEAKFPAAADDCYAATEWAAANGASIGGDPSRIAVGGDSAGGNLAAVVALMARDRAAPRLVHQLLVYPAIDPASNSKSQKEFAEGYLLSNADMIWFWGHYLNGPADSANPYANPARAKNLKGLPPATVITAGYDPLRDEGEAYAEQMKAAGVPVMCTRYDGATHGFFSMVSMLDIGKQGVAQACEALRAAYRK